jgi:hypothetical protein
VLNLKPVRGEKNLEIRIVNVDAHAAGCPARLPAEEPSPECPRCESLVVVILQKLGVNFNDCYHCRKCGHLFSPRRSS